MASKTAYSYCTQRPGNQLLIRSDADSISFDAGDCGAQTGLDLTAFPYSSLGQFCAAVTIENFRSGTVADVYAELVEVSPSAGYDGYRSPYGTGASPLDVTPGFNSPVDSNGGMWSYGDLAEGDENTVVWVLQNGGGPFRFRGRIVAPVLEIADGIDNDCDGRVDESLGLFGEGEACVDNEDCASGACDAGFCLRGCSPGFWGADCVSECPGGADDPCNGNGICNDDAGGDGTCDCVEPWGTAACDDCDEGHYGANCAQACPAVDGAVCSGNGTCDSGISGLGTCACDTGAHGETCEFTCGDGERNGDEDGVDCGAVCGSTCWGREVKFTAFDVDIRKQFSWSIDAYDNLLVAGATGEGAAELEDAGAFYIYENDLGEYRQVTRFESPVPQQNARFGYSVAVHGDVAVAGAPFERGSTYTNVGASYVYNRVGGEWVLAGRLVSDVTNRSNLRFGGDVETDGTQVFVSSTGHRCCNDLTASAGDGNQNGAVFVFSPDGAGGYEQSQRLTVPTYGSNAYLGSSISVRGDLLAVGRDNARFDPIDTRRVGGVALFRRGPTGEWAFERLLDPPVGVLEEGDRYGTTVATGDNVVAIAARRRDTANGVNTGSVFVWRYDGAQWSYQELIEPAGRGLRNWGQRVTVDGDFIYVSGGGRVYVFQYDGSSYAFLAEYTRPPGPQASGFGGRIEVNEQGKIFVGAAFNSVLSDRGTVFVYDRLGDDSLDFTQRIVPADVQVGDAFGWEVDMDGDRVVAGAFGEDAAISATSVRADVGAVYLFRRDGAVWSDEQKLEEPELQNGANFGVSVDLSGDALAVGAHRFNPPRPTSGTYSDAGIVYLYRFDGTTWNLAASVVSPDRADTQRYGLFGREVELQGEWLFVSSDYDPQPISPEEVDDPPRCVNAGVVDVFRYNPAGTPGEGFTEAWDHFARLDQGDTCGAQFGTAIDGDGTRVVIGAFGWAPSSRGSVFVYDYDGNDWVSTARLFRQTQAQNAENLGRSVAVSGDTVVAGSPYFDRRSNGHTGASVWANSGRVSVFRFEGGVWNEGAWFDAPSLESNARLGTSVDIEDGFVVAGATGLDGFTDVGGVPTSQLDVGAVYVFRDEGAGAWTVERSIVGTDVDEFDQFGRTVAIVDRRISVGAVFEDVLDEVDAGAAYVYE